MTAYISFMHYDAYEKKRTSDSLLKSQEDLVRVLSANKNTAIEIASSAEDESELRGKTVDELKEIIITNKKSIHELNDIVKQNEKLIMDMKTKETELKKNITSLRNDLYQKTSQVTSLSKSLQIEERAHEKTRKSQSSIEVAALNNNHNISIQLSDLKSALAAKNIENMNLKSEVFALKSELGVTKSDLEIAEHNFNVARKYMPNSKTYTIKTKH